MKTTDPIKLTDFRYNDQTVSHGTSINRCFGDDPDGELVYLSVPVALDVASMILITKTGAYKISSFQKGTDIQTAIKQIHADIARGQFEHF